MQQDPQVMSMITLAIGSVLWIIMMIITLKSEFTNKNHKKYWIIALLLFPPSCLLFPFIGMKQTK